MVPKCFDCASPCGKNNDFTLDKLKECSLEELYLKNSLFSALRMIAFYLHESTVSSSLLESSMEFLYKGFFFIGYDCETKHLVSLFQEVGKIQAQLFQEIYNTSKE